MRVIKSEKMPESNGHYSQAIEHKGILYLSGQLPIDSLTGKVPPTIEEQTYVALDNVQNILKAAGSTISQILQVRIYISDIALWDKVNDAYAIFFKEHKPVRSIIPTRNLHYGSMIEIEATAVLSE
jgi:2-iminobutanoate/2-iminopropanoate deaminase